MALLTQVAISEGIVPIPHSTVEVRSRVSALLRIAAGFRCSYSAHAELSQPLPRPIAPAGALDALRVFSLSHRTCGLSALGGVIVHGDAARIHASLTTAGIESIVLSTCNRFEVYWRGARRR